MMGARGFSAFAGGGVVFRATAGGTAFFPPWVILFTVAQARAFATLGLLLDARSLLRCVRLGAFVYWYNLICLLEAYVSFRL